MATTTADTVAAPVAAPAAAPAAALPKVTLHWLEKSRSQRIVWLLQECKGIDLQIKTYKRQSDMLAPPELKSVHPLGKSPLVTVEVPGQTKPLVLAESAFISEYLTDNFAQHLAPAKYAAGQEPTVGLESESWTRYRFYMHYAEGSLMSLLMVKLFMDQIKNAPQPFFIKPITRTITGRVDAAFLSANYATHFSFLNEQLASSPDNGEYLCGAQLTAADILLSFPLIVAKSDDMDFSKYPKLKAYIDRLEAHPGYLASVKKIEEATGEKFENTLRGKK